MEVYPHVPNKYWPSPRLWRNCRQDGFNRLTHKETAESLTGWWSQRI